MGSIDNPVIRLFFIFAGGFLLSTLYIMVTGFLPGSLQWFPFGVFPSFGSPPYLLLFTVSTLISGILWWYVFFVHGRSVKKDLIAQGIIQK